MRKSYIHKIGAHQKTLQDMQCSALSSLFVIVQSLDESQTYACLYQYIIEPAVYIQYSTCKVCASWTYIHSFIRSLMHVSSVSRWHPQGQR